MNIFMYTNRFGVYMAGKLYWRIKKDGKWTWKPVTEVDKLYFEQGIFNAPKEEEE